MVKYGLIKELPLRYDVIVRELREAGFNINELLDGCYDSKELFESSKALRMLAIDKMVDELMVNAVNNPNDYIDGYGKFGYTISINEFVDDFLDNLRKYYTKVSE